MRFNDNLTAACILLFLAGGTTPKKQHRNQARGYSGTPLPRAEWEGCLNNWYSFAATIPGSLRLSTEEFLADQGRAYDIVGRWLRLDRSAARFLVVLGSQRSASTTLINRLNRGLGDSYHMHHETFRENGIGEWMKRALPSSMTGSRARAQPCAFRRAFTASSLCAGTLVCGLKVFRGQLENDDIGALVDCDDGRSTRVVVLKRENRTAQYASYQHAMKTGNWGTTPSKQKHWTNLTSWKAEPLTLPEYDDALREWYARAEALHHHPVKTEELIADQEGRVVARIDEWVRSDGEAAQLSGDVAPPVARVHVLT